MLDLFLTNQELLYHIQSSRKATDFKNFESSNVSPCFQDYTKIPYSAIYLSILKNKHALPQTKAVILNKLMTAFTSDEEKHITKNILKQFFLNPKNQIEFFISQVKDKDFITSLELTSMIGTKESNSLRSVLENLRIVSEESSFLLIKEDWSVPVFLSQFSKSKSILISIFKDFRRSKSRSFFQKSLKCKILNNLYKNDAVPQSIKYEILPVFPKGMIISAFIRKKNQPSKKEFFVYEKILRIQDRYKELYQLTLAPHCPVSIRKQKDFFRNRIIWK